MITIKTFVFNPFGENTYILSDESKEAIIVDPGNYVAHEHQELVDYIVSEGLKPVMIANTHAHVDHVLGVAFTKRQFGIPFKLHTADWPLLRSVKVYASNYGFHGFEEPEVDEALVEGEEIVFGNSRLQILFLPGHAPGHVGFYSEQEKFVIGGDVLFRQSIGRTDLPQGDFPTLEKTIKEKLYVLPDDVKVYPGHGEPTTIGFEKKNNHFVRA